MENYIMPLYQAVVNLCSGYCFQFGLSHCRKSENYMNTKEPYKNSNEEVVGELILLLFGIRH